MITVTWTKILSKCTTLYNNTISICPDTTPIKYLTICVGFKTYGL